MNKTLDCLLAATTVAIIAVILNLGCSGLNIDYGKVLNQITNSVPTIVPTTTTTTSTTTPAVTPPPVTPPSTNKPPVVIDYSGTYHPAFSGLNQPSIMFRYWTDIRGVNVENPKSAVWTLGDGSMQQAIIKYGWVGLERPLPIPAALLPLRLKIIGNKVTKYYRIDNPDKQPQEVYGTDVVQ